MKTKRLFAGLLVAILLIMGCVPAALAEKNATVKLQYSTSSLHLRAGAGTKYDTVAYLHHGDSIVVIADGTNWSKVRVTATGKVGFIMSKYIYYGVPAKFEKGKNVYVSKSGGSLNLRAGKGTEYASLGIVVHGESISIVTLGTEWTKIRVTETGKVGYIKTKYIYGYGDGADTPSKTSAPKSYEAGTVKTKYSSSTVNLRASASATSNKVGTVKRGTLLRITGSTGNWYKVYANGVTGFISKSYVSLGVRAKVTASTLNVRKGPSSNAAQVAQIKKNASVTVYSVDDDWAYIRYNTSKYGYASMKYLKY